MDGLNTLAGEIEVEDDYTVVEWLEVQRVRGSGAPAGVRVVKTRNILLSHLLLHDNAEGVRVSGPGGSDFTVRNSMIYNNDDDGIGGDEITDTILAENCTVYGNGDNGLDESDGTAFTATNTISVANGNQDFDIPAGTQLQTSPRTEPRRVLDLFLFEPRPTTQTRVPATGSSWRV